MARKKNLDEVWDEIFDSLVLDNEPPFEYIKNATIVTKAGMSFKVNAVDFAQILERERRLTPEESEILSCRLAINFTKVRKDVDQWASQLLSKFDSQGTPAKTKSTKATKTQSSRNVAKTKTRKAATKSTAKKTVSSKNSTKKG